MGRKMKKLDYYDLKKLKVYEHLDNDDIARIMGVSMPTLLREIKRLHIGEDVANGALKCDTCKYRGKLAVSTEYGDNLYCNYCGIELQTRSCSPYFCDKYVEGAYTVTERDEREF